MAELKRTFSQAKMNKDMDERLVPNGQYRDANNIQVVTSDGSDVGTVQTLFGNAIRNTMSSTIGVYDIHTKSTCVGSIAAPDKDKIYYFVAGGREADTDAFVDSQKDYIMEYDTISETLKYVFVDIYSVKKTHAAVQASTSLTDKVSISTGAPDTHGIRLGMAITGTFTNTTGSTQIIAGQSVQAGETYTLSETDEVFVTHNYYDTNGGADGSSIRTYYLSKPISVAAGESMVFTAPRVLNFNKGTYITGLNILDDFIYWTDNEHEPKKISITRSILGTGGTTELQTLGSPSNTFDGDTPYFHTRLTAENHANYSGGARVVYSEVENNFDFPQDSYQANVSNDDLLYSPVYVRELHTTVIRKAPTQPLHLKMFRSSEPRINSDGEENPTYATQSNQAYIQAGTINVLAVVDDVITVGFDQPVDFRVNDVLLVSAADDNYDPSGFNGYDIRMRVIDTLGEDANADVLYSQGFSVRILNISTSITPDQLNWYVRLEDKDPLFEFKFPRFSYRYKYTDGEYSPFAPWSEIAFLPDVYEYKSKKGHNLGMVNQLRGLTLCNYFHRGYEYSRHNLAVKPEDVAEIDILYKETGDNTVYTVKTLKPTDGSPIWPTFNYAAVQQGQYDRGEFKINTDTIYAAVPSNQILRPYDNVPRKALAQEISANRLIYGNYVQGYNVLADPVIEVGYRSKVLGKPDSESDAIANPDGYEDSGYALPSVKSMRKYQIGVVFSDGYGRETPVLTTKQASVAIPKTDALHVNRLTCRLNDASAVPSWAKYFSYYVKEITEEYYTLAMDRWYRSFDGNIWLSFASSDRNKLDLEDYITLKKKHGRPGAIEDRRKYKVLAIENEAPDYIKRKRKDLGVIVNTTGNLIGNNVEGYPLPDTNFITLDLNAVEANMGDLLEDPPEAYEIQITDGTNTVEYEIDGMPVEDGSSYRFNLVDEFGEEISFASSDGTFAGRVIGLQVNVFEVRADQLKEFDGRFFVKIYKDKLLEEYLFRGGEEDLVIDASMGLRYINNGAWENINNNGPIPSNLIQRNLIESGDFDGFNASRHPTEHPWHWDETHAFYQEGNNPYFWGEATSATSSTTASGQNASSHNINNTNINSNPILALNTDFSQGHASDFWKKVAEDKDIFIDCCTAFSWTGANRRYLASEGTFAGEILPSDATQQINGFALGEAPGSFYQDDHDWCEFQGSSNNEGGFINTGNTFIPSSTGVYFYEGNQTQNQYGAFGEKRGEPSRGIWGPNNTYMDVSTCMPSGWNEESQGAIPHQTLSEDPSWLGSRKNEFMQQFVQPGCRFRFRKDPDHIIYTVQEDHHSPGSYMDYGSGYYLGDPGDPENPSLFAMDNHVGADAQRVIHNYTYRTAVGKINGVYGIVNYVSGAIGEDQGDNWTGGPQVDALNKHWFHWNKRQRWTVVVSPGIGTTGQHGYNPIRGTKSPEFGGPIKEDVDNYRRAIDHDFRGKDVIDILVPNVNNSAYGSFTEDPGVWETVPKETVDLDIFWQASPLIPIHLSSETNEELIPLGSNFTLPHLENNQIYKVTRWISDDEFEFTPSIPDNQLSSSTLAAGAPITFNKGASKSRYNFTARTFNPIGLGFSNNSIRLYGSKSTMSLSAGPDLAIWSQQHVLDWNNCWSFGNGVESDRVRDDFNGKQMDNGAKASSVIAEQIREERRKHGLIWSGIYNSISGMNNANQFIQAENITKDLNPVYGSIQALLNRDTRLIMFCEDKVLRSDTNKDLIFNADGNSQLVGSNKVVGSAVPYKGKYGIATHPESLVATPYTVYFSDLMRGHVLRLTNEGLVSISDKGMKDYFADTSADYSNIYSSLGSYDERKKEYNLSISKKYDREPTPFFQQTISFSEIADGWTSFKSYYPQSGVSINNNYYTFGDGVIANDSGTVESGGQLYKHHQEFYTDMSTIVPRNNFYGRQYTSDVTLLFNDQPADVKGFTTLKYEGSENKILQFSTSTVNMYNNNYDVGNGLVSTSVTDGEYYNLTAQNGWYVDEINTDLQECDDIYFKKKEGKYFAYPSGKTTGHTTTTPGPYPGTATDTPGEVTLENNASDFSVQGIGLASITHSDPTMGRQVYIGVLPTMFNQHSGGATGTNWDSVADLQEFTGNEGTVIQQGVYRFDNNSSPDAGEYNLSGIGDVAYTVPSYEEGQDVGADQIINLPLTPILSNGSYSGYPLSASNFKIGGATETNGSGVATSGTNIYEGGNMDSPVIKVEFVDTGTPGIPSNRVVARCTLDPTFEPPASPLLQTYYIDIDTIETPGLSTKKSEFLTEYQVLDVDEYHPTVANGGVADITTHVETEIVSGGDIIITEYVNDEGETIVLDPPVVYPNPLPYTVNTHKGNVFTNTQNEVARVEFSISDTAQNYYADVPTSPRVDFLNMLSGFNGVDYFPYYSYEITNKIYGTPPSPTAGLLQGFTVRIYYNPPSDFYPADPENFIAMGHTARIMYKELTIPQEPPGIVAVDYNSIAPTAGGEIPIIVHGAIGTSYTINVEKKISLTSDVTAATGGYFNFRSSKFQDDPVVMDPINSSGNTYTIRGGDGTVGIRHHWLQLPVAEVDTRYDITIDPVVNGVIATTAPDVPLQAGDAIITQLGAKTLTIKPVTYETGFFTMPSLEIKRESTYPRKIGTTTNPFTNTQPIAKTCEATGGTGNVSSTRLVLDRDYSYKVKKGMFVAGDFNNTITHKTKVVAVRNNVITLSNACVIPDNTKILFIDNVSSVTPFSLTVKSSGSKTVYKKDEATVDLNNVVGGINSRVRQKINGAVNSSTTITLDSTKGIIPGMKVVGDKIKPPSGGRDVVVSSVTNGTQIVVDTAQILDDDTSLNFSFPTDSTNDVRDGDNNVSLLQIQTSIADGGIKIEGYLQVKEINTSSDILIYLDELATVN